MMSQVASTTDLFKEVTFQRIVPNDDQWEDEKTDCLQKYISQTEHPKELMAILMNLLRNTKDVSAEYEFLTDYILELWKRIVALSDISSSYDVLNLLDILNDSTFEDTFETMVKPLIVSNTKFWLTTTIRVLKQGEDKYYILNTRNMSALFSCANEMKKIVPSLKEYISEEDKLFMEDYVKLVNEYGNLASRITSKEPSEAKETEDKSSLPPQNDEESFNETCLQLEITKFPNLKPSSIGMDAFVPIGYALMQSQKSYFWQNKTNRIHREPLDAFFADEI